ncbi:MAG TPA: PAS domain S-box protein, partial [Gemmatimonadaceae bacterium]|nr:PAS domain S-box protein [Gemmatimonadaceae bacterium]
MNATPSHAADLPGTGADRATPEREAHQDLIERIAGIGSWEIDLATDRIYWSREQCRIHGVTAETAPPTHQAFLRMVHPEDLSIVNDGMAALVPHLQATAEFRIVRPDGAVRLLQAHALLVAADDGGFTRVLGTSLDITERRATELALRASEKAYRALFQHAFDAMWVHDLHTGELLELNEAAIELFGYSAEEQKALGMSGLTASDRGFTTERGWEYYRKAAAGEPQQFEWMGYHKDGRPVWEEMRLTAITVGGRECLVATARDISARKAAELAQQQANEELERRVAERTAALAQEIAERTAAQEALREQEEHFRRLIENSNDQVFIFDTTGAVTFVGPSVERLLGVTPEEMLGQRPVDVIHPDDVPTVMTTIGKAINHPGQSFTNQYRIRH